MTKVIGVTYTGNTSNPYHTTLVNSSFMSFLNQDSLSDVVHLKGGLFCYLSERRMWVVDVGVSTDDGDIVTVSGEVDIFRDNEDQYDYIQASISFGDSVVVYSGCGLRTFTLVESTSNYMNETGGSSIVRDASQSTIRIEQLLNTGCAIAIHDGHSIGVYEVSAGYTYTQMEETGNPAEYVKYGSTAVAMTGDKLVYISSYEGGSIHENPNAFRVSIPLPLPSTLNAFEDPCLFGISYGDADDFYNAGGGG